MATATPSDAMLLLHGVAKMHVDLDRVTCRMVSPTPVIPCRYTPSTPDAALCLYGFETMGCVGGQYYCLGSSGDQVAVVLTVQGV